MKTFKSFTKEDVKEPVQPWDPRSEGEQRFKHMHNPINHKNLVPGVTDQDHVFNGGERRYDPPTASYEKSADVAAYDKNLTKEEVEHLDEADLTKIDRKTLEALTQLHKYYGQKDPRSKASAERGEAELKRRDNEKKEKMKESTLPPHLAKMFNKKGDFKDPKKHAIYKGIQDRLAKKDLGVDAKDHKSEYSKMRASMGVDDKATTRKLVGERTLTPAEMKKREEIAKAIGRENPKMDMSKKMAIATAQAKKIAESVTLDEKVNSQAFVKKYRENEEENMHSDNVVHLAKHFGNSSDQKKALEIKQQHDKEGGLSRELSAKRNALHDKLWKKAEPHFDKVDKIKEEVELQEEGHAEYMATLPDMHRDLKAKKKSTADMRREYGSSWKRLLHHTNQTYGVATRTNAIKMAKQHMSEEVEQIDEETHSEYMATLPDMHKDLKANKSTSQMRDDYGSAYKMLMHHTNKHYGVATRANAIKMAKKHMSEEVEQIDEISKATLGSYVKKASHDVATKSAATGRYADRANKVRDEIKKGEYGNYQQGKKDDAFAEKMFKKSWKRRLGIAKAVDKMTKESLELDEAKRGRPRKDGSTKPAGSDEDEGGREHIIVQYRKAERMPEKEIEHNDNSKHAFPKAHYTKALNMHSGMKPAEKETFEKRLASSKASALSAVAGEPAPKPKPKISLGGKMHEAMTDPSTTRADKGNLEVDTYRDANGVLRVTKRKAGSKGEVKIGEAKDLNAKNVKTAVKHDCATHVEHAEWGVGNCVPEMHTIEEISEGIGYVTHYDVMFEHGIEQNVPVESLKILASEEHGHAPKKSMKEALVGGQKKIDANHNGKLDAGDFAILRNKFRKFRPKRLEKVNEAEEMTAATVKAAADTQYAKGQSSKENMQQDSINKMKTDPLASKESIMLPPTQGNKPIGGETENPARVGGKYSVEEERLTNLFNSLSEENQEKFAAMIETDEGFEQLLDFAEKQGF